MTNTSSNTIFTLYKNNKAILRISNPVSYDMFWHSYDVEYLVNDPELVKELQLVSFWDDVKFINDETNKVAEFAGISLTPFDENGGLLIRGEYHI